MALLLLCLPTIIVIFVLCYIPMYGILLPFKNFKPILGVFGSPWAGLKNFGIIFQTNQVLKVTITTVSMNLLFIVSGTITGILLAILLFEVRKSVRAYQTIYLMPYYLSFVVVSFILLGILDDHGLINTARQAMSLPPIHFYTEPQYWPGILVITNIWKGAGYGAVIYFATLTSIDPTYFEAASIDGASKVKQIWHIALPTILPLVTMLTLLSLGRVFFGSLDMFKNVTLDSAAVRSTTDVIDTFVLRALKTSNNIGLSSAVALYQSVCGFILVLISNLVARKISPEGALF